jgi:hypothetical protein
MTMIDIGCYERGCACYDSRIPAETAETVEVVRRDWIGLTDEEVDNFLKAVWGPGVTPENFIRAIETKLKDKNG